MCAEEHLLPRPIRSVNFVLSDQIMKWYIPTILSRQMSFVYIDWIDFIHWYKLHIINNRRSRQGDPCACRMLEYYTRKKHKRKRDTVKKRRRIQRVQTESSSHPRANINKVLSGRGSVGSVTAWCSAGVHNFICCKLVSATLAPRRGRRRDSPKTFSLRARAVFAVRAGTCMCAGSIRWLEWKLG